MVTNSGLCPTTTIADFVLGKTEQASGIARPQAVAAARL
jgi:hypothetical protein